MKLKRPGAECRGDQRDLWLRGKRTVKTNKATVRLVSNGKFQNSCSIHYPTLSMLCMSPYPMAHSLRYWQDAGQQVQSNPQGSLASLSLSLDLSTYLSRLRSQHVVAQSLKLWSFRLKLKSLLSNSQGSSDIIGRGKGEGDRGTTIRLPRLSQAVLCSNMHC